MLASLTQLSENLRMSKIKIAAVVIMALIVCVILWTVITSPREKMKGPSKIEIVIPQKDSNAIQPQDTRRNILIIYTGRWKFLRVLLAHVYRELRKNGGILNQVWFMMIKYDSHAHERLQNFVKIGNQATGGKEVVFSIHYLGTETTSRTTEDYTVAYYELFDHIIQHPYDKFFKFDDDVVYIHPRAFNSLLQNKDNSKCFMHFFNIAGSNWRCSWLYQQYNVYNETNPKNLQFEYNPSADCGWKNNECGELTIRTFLYHYKKQQLSRYCFPGLMLDTDRKRFSINAFLLDKDLINVKAMLKVGKMITGSDEAWWTEKYSLEAANPNCVVGEALVVHFAYRVVADKLLSLGLFDDFVSIVTENKESFRIEPEVWKALDY